MMDGAYISFPRLSNHSFAEHGSAQKSSAAAELFIKSKPASYPEARGNRLSNRDCASTKASGSILPVRH